MCIRSSLTLRPSLPRDANEEDEDIEVIVCGDDDAEALTNLEMASLRALYRDLPPRRGSRK